MADVTGSIIIPDNLVIAALRGEIDLEDDTLKMGLSSSLYAPSTSHVDYSDIVGELSGDGYSQVTLANKTLSYDDPYTLLVFDDPVFTASGADWVVRSWWIFDDTHGSDILIAMGLIDATDIDVTVVDGQPLTMHLNALGLFRTVRA